MLDANDAELAAVRRSFSLLVARWRLTQGEVRNLLGGGTLSFGEGRILPDDLGSDAETRVRLLLRLESALEHLAAGTDVCAQIRRCKFGSCETPLSSLSSLSALRWAVRNAEQRCSLEEVLHGQYH